MYVADGMSPKDIPAPPTFEQIAANFGGPIFTLAPQPVLREAGWSTQASYDTLEEVSASYSVFRNPDNLEDPANFIDDVESILASMRTAESSGQPKWFVTAVRNARYPLAADVVRTVIRAARPDQSLADLLVNHLNQVLINSIAARRQGGWRLPPALDRPVTSGDAHGVTASVDESHLNGLVIDSDADAVGWAVEVGDRAVSLVLLRELLPLIDPRLVTRRV
jgi:hypothetical protein